MKNIEKRGAVLSWFVFIVLIIVLLSTGVFNDFLGGITSKVVFDSANLNTNLVAYYPLDGSGKDLTGLGAGGRIQGVTKRASCIKGECYRFDGINDYIDLRNLEDVRKSVTFAGWTKIQETGVDRVLYDRGEGKGGYQIYLGNGKKLNLVYRWDNGDSGYSVCTSKNGIDIDSWYHVAAVANIDEKKIRLYLNGNEECNANITPINSIFQSGQIGSAVSGGAVLKEGFWDGIVDEVSIWNRALSASEIKEVYESYDYISSKIESEEETTETENISNETTEQENNETTKESETIKEGFLSWWKKFIAFFNGG